ncbi:unnamed protein product [Cuscuta epithymum]|uniref:Uncharacterized protein n=1 Tax=Cuscuta epithymum TaxID=186058 RepID=A0AAV0FJL9_9ASTE|nr:unnamed protein product [Cuscuta epithymum]
MVFLRIFCFQSLFPAVHALQNPITQSHSCFSTIGRFSRLLVIHQRSVPFSYPFCTKTDTDSDNIDVRPNKRNKKPLDFFFKEAVGILEALPHDGHGLETGQVRCKLRNLEEEVRVLQENSKKQIDEKIERRERKIQALSKKDDEATENQSIAGSLQKLFTNNSFNSSKAPMEKDLMVGKRLSSEMVMLVTHLYEEGYFKDANFLRKNRFDITRFDDSYALHYIKHAVREFATDKQEVVKWLSASDLKKVALFGCPSVVKKNVYSAKVLRRFFKIQEDTVCGKCGLRDSCKFENQNMWNSGNAKVIHLHHVMRIIILYALESVPQELHVPEEIKESVNRLLEEVVNLSKVC